MPDWNLVSRSHVFAAMKECDNLGSKEFLRRYGFGRAVAYTLWHRHLKHDPKAPTWFDRDRFVLSAGHTVPLVYTTLATLNETLRARRGCVFDSTGMLMAGTIQPTTQAANAGGGGGGAGRGRDGEAQVEPELVRGFLEDGGDDGAAVPVGGQVILLAVGTPVRADGDHGWRADVHPRANAAQCDDGSADRCVHLQHAP